MLLHHAWHCLPKFCLQIMARYCETSYSRHICILWRQSCDHGRFSGCHQPQCSNDELPSWRLLAGMLSIYGYFMRFVGHFFTFFSCLTAFLRSIPPISWMIFFMTQGFNWMLFFWILMAKPHFIVAFNMNMWNKHLFLVSFGVILVEFSLGCTLMCLCVSRQNSYPCI